MKKILLTTLAILTLSIAGWAIADSATSPAQDSVEVTMVDFTSKLANPNFNDGTKGWTVNKGKDGSFEVKAASTGNPVVTAYGYQLDIWQKVTGLEPGKYIVKVQACSRYKDGKAGIEEYEAKKAAGEEIPNEAYIYANGQQTKVLNIWDETAKYDFAAESGHPAENLTMSNEEQIPYNSTNFANAFGKLGMYENEVACTVGKDGELTLGIKNELPTSGNNIYIGFDNFRLYRVGDLTEEDEQPGDEPTVDESLVEIEQNQGKELDDFKRAELVEGEEYNTYTVDSDLQIAMKMMNIDVAGCDYVIIKFAEPVAAGWRLAFWSNQDLTEVPEGATEYKYVFADDSKCGVSPLVDGVAGEGAKLPQICMMTFFGGFTAPLEAKVVGVYKHIAQAEDQPGDEPGDEPAEDELDMSKLTDMTNLLANPNFNDGQNGWTVNTGKIEVKAASTGNPVITAYDYQVDICQTVTGLEPGKYVVMVQACSRHMMGQAGIQDYESKKAKGQEIQNEAYLYANGEQKKVKNIYDEGADYDFAGESGQSLTDLRLSNGKQIPYNSTNFAHAFGDFGMYQNYVICNVGQSGVLTLGVKNELLHSGDIIPYLAYDNFRLYKMNEEEDCTSMLANPNFNDGTNGWTVNEGKIEVKAASTGNPVVTAYGYQVDICQTVEGLKPGKYLLKVNACSRYMDKKAGIDDYEARKAAGKEIPNEAYIYANGEQKKVVNIWDETSTYDFATESGQAASDLTMSNGEQIPYNSTNFAHAFGELGMYENELECVVGQNGVLTLGIKNELKGDGYQPYVGYDNFRLYRIGDAEEDGPEIDLYDLKAEAGQYVAISMPYAVKSEYFGQVYKIAEIQDGKAVLVAVDGVASGEPCVVKATGESNVKEGDVTLSYTSPKPSVSMWDNTMMQADLNKLTWTATAIDGSAIDVASLTYTEADLSNMDFTCTIENNAAARFWAQNPDYAAETPTQIGKFLNLPAYNRTDQPNPIVIPVVAAEKDQFLSYSLDEDMLTVETLTVPAGKTVAEIYNLLPGLTYYYKTADGKSAGKFTVGGTLRMIMIGKNVVNMRDLGGKKTVDGRYVKYGKIYRNAEFKGGTFNIDATELQMLLDMNIGAELDLRNEDGNKPWLPGAKRGDNFYWAEGKNYIANGPGKMYDAVAIPHLKAEFETVVKNLRKGVAVDFHCRIGADRTGFLAFLLEGLLGVSESDILRDYETTSFSEAGLRTKADGDGDAAASSYEKVIPAEFRSKIPEGGTLRDVFEAYFINTLGVDKALIDEYRDIMLADSPIADIQAEQTNKYIAVLRNEITNAGLYVWGDDFGQYTMTDQSAVDKYMKTAEAAELFLNESEGIASDSLKAQIKGIMAAANDMKATISLNMPKAGDKMYLISKNYGKYIVPRSKTSYTVQGTEAEKCIFTFDGQNLVCDYTELTFGIDAKNGIASAAKLEGAEPTVIVPSEAGTVGCYNIKIGDYTLITAEKAGTQLPALVQISTDADIIIKRVAPEEPDAIQSIEMADQNAASYNLSGQKVSNSYKGVIIRDGKKLMVK